MITRRSTRMLRTSERRPANSCVACPRDAPPQRRYARNARFPRCRRGFVPGLRRPGTMPFNLGVVLAGGGFASALAKRPRPRPVSLRRRTGTATPRGHRDRNSAKDRPGPSPHDLSPYRRPGRHRQPHQVNPVGAQDCRRRSQVQQAMRHCALAAENRGQIDRARPTRRRRRLCASENCPRLVVRPALGPSRPHRTPVLTELPEPQAELPCSRS